MSNFKPIEFYKPPTDWFGGGIFDMASPDKRRFNALSDGEIIDLFNHLLKCRKPNAALRHLRNYFNDRRQMLRAFVECNFSKLDQVKDITETRINVEDVDCVHKGKGTCPFQGEGIVCIKT